MNKNINVVLQKHSKESANKFCRKYRLQGGDGCHCTIIDW